MSLCRCVVASLYRCRRRRRLQVSDLFNLNIKKTTIYPLGIYRCMYVISLLEITLHYECMSYDKLSP